MSVSHVSKLILIKLYLSAFNLHDDMLQIEFKMPIFPLYLILAPGYFGKFLRTVA